MKCLAWPLAVLTLLAATPVSAAPPERRSGTATVKVSGGQAVEGTFKATCGAYFMADAPGVGKAGDGLVYETTIPAVGTLQVTAWQRKPGLVKEGGVNLGTPDGSYLADHASGAKVNVGPDLWTATVSARATAFPRARKGRPAAYQLEVKFDCTK